MAASDSFVGEHLNPSPYKEALAEWRKAIDLLEKVHPYVEDQELWEEVDWYVKNNGYRCNRMTHYSKKETE